MTTQTSPAEQAPVSTDHHLPSEWYEIGLFMLEDHGEAVPVAIKPTSDPFAGISARVDQDRLYATSLRCGWLDSAGKRQVSDWTTFSPWRKPSKR